MSAQICPGTRTSNKTGPILSGAPDMCRVVQVYAVRLCSVIRGRCGLIVVGDIAHKVYKEMIS